MSNDSPQFASIQNQTKNWSEVTYEVKWGELRMEVYISFLYFIGSAGDMVINLFGGLKPIVVALVSPIFASFIFEFLPIFHMHIYSFDNQI